MEPKTTTTTASPSLTSRNRRGTSIGRQRRWPRFLRLTAATFLLAFMLFTIWFYLTPWGRDFRYLMADTLITTQHRHWAKYLIGENNLKERVEQYNTRFDEMANVPQTQEIPIPSDYKADQKKPLIEIEEVEGPKYKGYIMTVHDPKSIRLVVPNRVGKGEKVSSMVERTGATAGVNAGGFADPNWKGNGFQPIGIVISNGRILYNDGSMTTPINVVGLDKDGRMIAGKYSPNELLKKNMKEAVTFQPRFIVDGKGLIKNQADGWGIAPRTCMAQKADGSIMFAIIDGRQTHSLGATLYDIQDLFLKRGAVIAANLDGGSSTVLVKGIKSEADAQAAGVPSKSGITGSTNPGFEIVNSPASEYGERYLPTAFLVFDKPDSVYVKDIWDGIDMTKFDASKW